MAVTIVATAKSASANSYVTLAEAETYMESRVDVAAWDGSSTDTKNRSLVTATNRLEQQDFHGTPTDSDQRLKWPRSGTYDLDGRAHNQDTVPRPVKEATYELALALLKGDFELSDSGLEGFRSARVGPMDVEVNLGYLAGTLPREVARKLRNLMVGSNAFTIGVGRT